MTNSIKKLKKLFPGKPVLDMVAISQKGNALKLTTDISMELLEEIIGKIIKYMRENRNENNNPKRMSPDSPKEE